MNAASTDGANKTSTRGWILACALVVFVCQFRPIDDADLFTQIALGWEQLKHGIALSTEPFTIVNLGQSVANPGWLSQVVFAALHELGGLLLIRCIFALIIGMSFATLLSLDRRRPTAVPAIIATLISFLAIASNTSVRPQGFAVGCFAIVLWLAVRRPRYWPAWTAATMILWQNLHPSISIMLVVAAGFLVWCGFRKVQRTRCLGWAFVALLTVPASALTPDGLTLWRVTAQNSQIARDLLQISEWQPPWAPSVQSAMWGFWIALFSTIAIWAFVRRFPRLTPAWIVLLFATFYASRFALFWGVVNAAVLAELIMNSRLRNLFAHSGEMLTRLPLRTVSCLLIVVPLVFHSGDTISSRLPVRDLISISDMIPRPARVYNYREWGGSIVYALYPDAKVAIDGRLYLYPQEEWKRYVLFADAKIPVIDLTAIYQPNVLVLHTGLHRRLIDVVENTPEWERVYRSVGLPMVVYRKKLLENLQ